MDTSLTQHQAHLILNGLPHVGPVMFRRLMDAFDDNGIALLNTNKNTLLQTHGIGPKLVSVLDNWELHFNLSREERLLEERNTRFISLECSDYPKLLREIYDRPIGLYWKGDYTIDRPCVAIVGTRKATLYGLSVAKSFAADLASLGFCVVSGMARGIDTAVHEGALSVGSKTIAVQGSGLDIVYPPENLNLYKEIIDNGAVVSEFCFGRRIGRTTFPMRNRIVSGMCEAVIVIESNCSGGSMITARFAGEQCRDLMVIPGRIDQMTSAGCLQLLRDGATLVTSVDDVLEELRYSRPKSSAVCLPKSTDDTVSISKAEQSVLTCFSGGEILSPDKIAEHAKKSSAQVASILMSLELKKQLVKRSDGRFEAN